MEDIRKKVDALCHAWEEFKEANDKKNKNTLDTEKINRISSYIDSEQELINTAQSLQDHKKILECYMRGVPYQNIRTKGQPYMVADETYGGALVDQGVYEMVAKAPSFLNIFRKLSNVLDTNAPSLEVPVDLEMFELNNSNWSLERTSPGGTLLTDAMPVPAVEVKTYELYVQPHCTSKFLEDGAIDLAAWLTDKIANSMSSEEERVCISGLGSVTPLGLLNRTYGSTADTSTIEEIISGSAGQVTIDAMYKIYYALDERYVPNSSWIMSRNTLAEIRSLKSGDNYIWSPADKVGGNELIFGSPVYISRFMPSPTVNARAILFGDFKYATILANRKQLSVLKDFFSYKPIVAFYSTMRMGFEVINTHAIKSMKLSLTA